MGFSPPHPKSDVVPYFQIFSVGSPEGPNITLNGLLHHTPPWRFRKDGVVNLLGDVNYWPLPCPWPGGGGAKPGHEQERGAAGGPNL